MATLRLRIPDYLYKLACEVAKTEGISVNQLITLALAEKLSALATESYLEERAKRGSREKYEAALAKVSDVEPEEYDRLD